MQIWNNFTNISFSPKNKLIILKKKVLLYGFHWYFASLRYRVTRRLIITIKKCVPFNLYKILKFYLKYRFFAVRYKEVQAGVVPINFGVSQESVLGPMQYILHAADMPISQDCGTVIFANDTAIIHACRSTKCIRQFRKQVK